MANIHKKGAEKGAWFISKMSVPAAGVSLPPPPGKTKILGRIRPPLGKDYSACVCTVA